MIEFSKYFIAIESNDKIIKDYTNNNFIKKVDLDLTITGFKTPEELYAWMHENIAYSEFTKLKSPVDLCLYKKGSCHDQAVFARYYLNKMGLPGGIYLFLETSGNQGGITHSFAYYKKDNKYYWFETAWEPYLGIHEFSSIQEIFTTIKQFHKDGKFGNNKKYFNVIISQMQYKMGDTLQQLINRTFHNY